MKNIPTQNKTDLIKIVLFGPESTGKTTLSKQLANHYSTNWVPEFARDYLQEKWDTQQKICEPSDICPIAIGQMNLENKLSKTANQILFSDTDILETKIYAEIYYGFSPSELNEAISKNDYTLYFLTYIDTPWVADDLRDKPNEREEVFNSFKKALDTSDRKYVLLKGDKETRFKKAVRIIDELLNNE